MSDHNVYDGYIARRFYVNPTTHQEKGIRLWRLFERREGFATKQVRMRSLNDAELGRLIRALLAVADRENIEW